MKAMILAAGRGTRLRPFTDKKPKALFEIHQRTLLEWTILYLKKHGIREIVINVHHYSDQIIEYLEKNNGFGLNYCISDESNMLMDTGGAIVKASKYLKNSNPFVLTGIDVFTELDLGEMIRFHKTQKPLVTLAVKDRTTSRSLLFDNNMCLAGWCDNRSGEIKGDLSGIFFYALGFSAIHIIDPEIFNCITEKGPFPIIDLYLRLAKSYKIMGYRHDNSAWFELGRTEMIDEISKNPLFQRLIGSL